MRDSKHWDIEAVLSFRSADNGGRSSPTPPNELRPVLVMDGTNFVVRLDLEGTGPIFPGQTATVPIAFLDRENALTHCAVGKRFILRELRPIRRRHNRQVGMSPPSAAVAATPISLA
jgi:hypothetical protein